MPCSALIEPLEAADHLEDHIVHLVPHAEELGLVHAGGLGDVVVDVAVAQMPEGDEAAAGQQDARPPRPRRQGTAAPCETGTEMSCLIEPPSGFCDSEISSRADQNSARWDPTGPGPHR